MRLTVTPEQIRAAFDLIADDPSFKESADLVRAGRAPSEMLQALALRPEILRAFAGFSSCVYPGGLIERRIKELVIIEASRRNACQFCRDSHVAVARMLGLSDDPIALLDTPDQMSERERLAVEYTGAVMEDSTRVPDALFDRLRSAYTDAEIAELTFTIGYINMLNLFNNALRVAYAGEFQALASGDG
ncbi:MAG: carboxymuconolactone decarboxylase family protein [Planctomycetota bacterium]|nr:MAG: carboxymuconolactone decarboxylase family protein [Planctomycetota bacterium]